MGNVGVASVVRGLMDHLVVEVQARAREDELREFHWEFEAVRMHFAWHRFGCPDERGLPPYERIREHPLRPDDHWTILRLRLAQRVLSI